MLSIYTAAVFQYKFTANIIIRRHKKARYQCNGVCIAFTKQKCSRIKKIPSTSTNSCESCQDNNCFNIVCSNFSTKMPNVRGKLKYVKHKKKLILEAAYLSIHLYNPKYPKLFQLSLNLGIIHHNYRCNHKNQSQYNVSATVYYEHLLYKYLITCYVKYTQQRLAQCKLYIQSTNSTTFYLNGQHHYPKIVNVT